MTNDTEQELETCPKCQASMAPIMTTEIVPSTSMRLDEEDPDYSSDDPYFDADGEVNMGFRVCRNCQTMLSFWIESATATFMPDWGERRPDQSQIVPANNTTDRALEVLHYAKGEKFRKAVSTIQAALERQRELSHMLERDRTAVCRAVNALRGTLHSYEWLRLGRGSYEYNDDRWRDEFSRAYEEIESQIDGLKVVYANWEGCPKTRREVKEAREPLERQRVPDGWLKRAIWALGHASGVARRRPGA